MTKKPKFEKIYRSEHISITFNSKRCSHSGLCLKSLPTVFDLKARPWINLLNCNEQDVIKTVHKCPSGALGFHETIDERVNVKLMKNGPINIRGKVNLKTGFQDSGQNLKRISLCRCGLSKNKPFCDASHLKEFRDDALIDKRPASTTKQNASKQVDIVCIENGPLMCQGNIQFSDSNKEQITVIDPAICRCGASKRKPFCDGTHNKWHLSLE